VHVEADLVRQVLVVYDDDEILRILPISSGANKPFPEPEGGYGSAKTPLGNFKFFAHIHGIHTGHLGDLFNPVYFEQGGYAVHGDTEVPPFNASHGCLRIPIRDSEWFEENVPLGAPLLVSETELPSFRPE
jgi:lipoprotein-anchoring transpeptidase ErfK/SrfK